MSVFKVGNKVLAVCLIILIGFSLVMGSPAASEAAASGELNAVLDVLDNVTAEISAGELWKLNESRDTVLNALDPEAALVEQQLDGYLQSLLAEQWDSDQLRFALRLLIRPSVAELEQGLVEIRGQYNTTVDELVGADPADILALFVNVDQDLYGSTYNNSDDFQADMVAAFSSELFMNASLFNAVVSYLQIKGYTWEQLLANPSQVVKALGFAPIYYVLESSYLPIELGPEPVGELPEEPGDQGSGIGGGGTPPPPPAQPVPGSQLLQTSEPTAVVGAGGAIKLNFPTAAVKVLDGQQALIIVDQLESQAAEQIIKSANPPLDWRGLGPVIHLQLRVGTPGAEQTVTSLEQPVAMELSFAGLDLQGLDPGSLDIFRIPDAGGTLEALGGRVDRLQQIIRAQVNGFSSFTLGYRERSFADLEGHWGRTDVLALAARGIVNGVADGRFAPDVTLTRAELAALLVRALNVPVKPVAASQFKDVAASAWYAAEVEAAAEAGLVAGYPDGSFAPNAMVTRLELAVMLGRALRNTQQNWGTTAVETALALFTDAAQVPAWARADAALTASRGIIRGLPGGLLSPAGLCTRAEAAVMLWRLMQQDRP